MVRWRAIPEEGVDVHSRQLVSEEEVQVVRWRGLREEGVEVHTHQLTEEEVEVRWMVVWEEGV